ncbi:class I SAM-dependent methyltransferase [Halorubrum sp. CSM-61]|uniref:class I SAM-dependent methyltransferase n=1 Tax=Halorubrum sp. CSM-61 TaxID=2485838 RepID=UPI000F4B5484|nr:class I SAM-dependent methyltransferase [Halorubrum sp. CSM-61]
MGFHTFDAEKADRLERPAVRYRWVSGEEVVGALTAERADRPAATVADLGSGTGFYTDAVAPHVGTVYGVDVQAEMHAFYREKGVPENVDLVESDVAALPFEDGELDAAFSTMTYHEFASDDAIAELARVIRTEGRLALFDWSAAGDGEHGPPADERFDASDAVAALEATGFEVLSASERTETFAVIARVS